MNSAECATWGQAETAWTRVLRAAGRSEQSIALRRHQLGRLAAAMRPRGPWSVTNDDLVAWLGSHGWARETLRSHRAMARSFYRWAHGAGLVAVDPAAALPAVRPSPPMPRPTNAEALRQALVSVTDERVHLLGHASPETTRRYVGADQDELRRTVLVLAGD